MRLFLPFALAVVLAACQPASQRASQISPACGNNEPGCAGAYEPYTVVYRPAETSQHGLLRVHQGDTLVCE